MSFDIISFLLISRLNHIDVTFFLMNSSTMKRLSCDSSSNLLYLRGILVQLVFCVVLKFHNTTILNYFFLTIIEGTLSNSMTFESGAVGIFIYTKTKMRSDHFIVTLFSKFKQTTSLDNLTFNVRIAPVNSLYFHSIEEYIYICYIYIVCQQIFIV